VGSLQAATLAELVATGERRGVGRLADAEAMTLPAEAALDAVIDALPASVGGWVPVLADDLSVLGIVSSTDVVRGWQHTMRGAVRRLTRAATSTTAVEGIVAPDSPLVGRPVSSLPLPRGAIVVSTLRDGTLRFPDAEQCLREGDQVTVLVRAGDVDTVRAALGPVPDAGGTSRPGGSGPGSAFRS